MAIYGENARITAVEQLPGVMRKVMVHNEQLMTCQFHLDKGAQLPAHSHPQAQSTYLVSGHFRVTAGGRTWEMHGGDAVLFAGGEEHMIEVLEDSVALDVFNPPREDFLK